MIKEFKEITEDNLQYMMSHPVIVNEKLDLIQFKVKINEEGTELLNSKNKPITDIDCLVNSVYKDIKEYYTNFVVANSTELTEKFGASEIGFFCKSWSQTKIIRYPNIKEKFIIGHFYTKEKQKNDIVELSRILSTVHLTPIAIRESIEGIEEVDRHDPVALVEFFTGGKTWSGNGIEEIEGIILTSGRLNYKITVNDVTPHIEKTTKKLYRDTVLENFCNVIYDIDDAKAIMNSRQSYIDKISKLFVLYVDKTNLFTRHYLEPEDLLPPAAGYIGDLDYTKLSLPIKLVCMSSDVYKNIFRILVVTFSSDVSKFDSFSPDIKDKLLYIYRKINKA